MAEASFSLPLQLTPEVLEAIASRAAEILGERRGDTDPGRDGYSMQEVADRLAVSLSTVNRRIKAGQIPTIPLISPPRIPHDYVARMMTAATP